MGKRVHKKQVSVEIDKLTNSIVNVITNEVFETEFGRVKKGEIEKKDWAFDWVKELADKENIVYKMTTVENKDIIQGLISISVDDNFIFVSLVENAKFNRGQNKLYAGVGGNLFAFACKVSRDMGFEGFVSFISKTSLIKYYSKTLGAQRTIGQRMILREREANLLINKYFKKH